MHLPRFPTPDVGERMGTSCPILRAQHEIDVQGGDRGSFSTILKTQSCSFDIEIRWLTFTITIHASHLGTMPKTLARICGGGLAMTVIPASRKFPYLHDQETDVNHPTSTFFDILKRASHNANGFATFWTF